MPDAELSARGAAVEVQRRLRPFATRPVVLITLGLVTALLLTSGRYGYFADELYFVAAGHELSWGYADQTPLVPLIALVMDELVPGSLVALRLPAIIAIGSGVLLTAGIARELGGDRRAQTIAAGAWAVSSNFAGMGHMLATASIDPVLWTAILWLLVRWVRLRESGINREHLLLWCGVLTAVAVQVKLLVPALWGVLVPVVLLLGPRDLLRRPLLWAGGLVTVVSAVPTLRWQAARGWPQWDMHDVVASENWWGPFYLPVAALCAGVVGAGLVCFGTWKLLADPVWRPYRFLGWTFVGVTAVFVVSNGRPYYVAGFFGLLFAVGAVALQQRRGAGSPGRRCWPWYAVSGLVAAASLPVLPVSAIPQADIISTGSLGWPQVTATVAEAHRAQPPGTAVVTHDYWTASALRHYGNTPGIRQTYSPGRGFWYFGHPPEGTQRALYLGSDRADLERFFDSVRPWGVIDTGIPAETQFDGKVVWIVDGPKQPWSQLWPRMQHMGLHD